METARVHDDASAHHARSISRAPGTATAPATGIVGRFLDAHTSRDLLALSALLAPKLRFTTLMGLLGKKDYVDFSRALLQAVPDARFRFEYFVVNGNDVSCVFSLAGTHTATFDLPAPGMKPLPPTGGPIAMEPARLHYVVEDGLIVAIYPEAGHAGGVVSMLRQMGAKLPPLWIVRTVNRLVRLFARG